MRFKPINAPTQADLKDFTEKWEWPLRLGKSSIPPILSRTSMIKSENILGTNCGCDG